MNGPALVPQGEIQATIPSETTAVDPNADTFVGETIASSGKARGEGRIEAILFTASGQMRGPGSSAFKRLPENVQEAVKDGTINSREDLHRFLSQR